MDVVEWLGNEAYAYIPFEAPPEVREQLTQLERDLDGESMRTQLVVSLDGASRIAEGDEATIWVDAAKIHLFDPATGENLTMDPTTPGSFPAATRWPRPRRSARAGRPPDDLIQPAPRGPRSVLPGASCARAYPSSRSRSWSQTVA